MAVNKRGSVSRYYKPTADKPRTGYILLCSEDRG